MKQVKVQKSIESIKKEMFSAKKINTKNIVGGEDTLDSWNPTRSRGVGTR